MPEKSPLTVIARVLAKPGQGAALRLHQKELVAAVVTEPGCLKYELHVSKENADLTLFVESWESDGLWQAHMEAPALAEFQRKVGHLVARVDIDRMTRIA